MNDHKYIQNKVSNMRIVYHTWNVSKYQKTLNITNGYKMCPQNACPSALDMP